jgi:predicted ATPase
VDLEPLTVLIGKNDTGKSSFLEAIQALSQTTSFDLPELFQGEWALPRIAWRGAPESTVSWEVNMAADARNRLGGPALYRLTLDAGPGGRAYVAAESLAIRGGEVSVEAARTAGNNRGEPLTKWSFKDGLSNRAPFDAVASTTALSMSRHMPDFPSVWAYSRHLGSTAQYQLDPRALRQPSHGDSSVVPSLRPDGSMLPSVLDHLLRVRRREVFEPIEIELSKAVPLIKSIQVPRGRLVANGPELESISFTLSNGATDVSSALVSDGVMLFLAYLTIVRSPDSPALILLEEPENGIHPRQLRLVVELLSGLTDETKHGEHAAQIVLATHSPYLLDFVPPKAVRVFGRKKNGETVVAPFESLKVHERLKSGFTVGELWYNVGEDALLKDLLDENAPGE